MEEDNKKIVQRELAQSVREKGSVKCPSCTSLIEWKDASQYNPDGSKDRYFWCSNEDCELHKKDVVKVSISKGFLQTFQQNFSKIGQGAIAALFGALSVWGYGYLNPSEGNDKELDKLKNELQEEQKKYTEEKDGMTKKMSDLKAQIGRLSNEGISVPPVSNSVKVDSLEKIIAIRDGEIAKKNTEIATLISKSGTSQLSPQEMGDLGIFYSTGKNKKSKKAINYLFQALKNPNAGFDDKEYQKLVHRLVHLGPSIELNQFEDLLTQVEKHIPNNMKDVERAKVYWYYADAQDDNKKYRELKLTSLKHYLQGASRYTISQQDIDDGMKLIELYQLNHIAPENFQSNIDIGIGFSNQNRTVIRSFLEYGKKAEAKLFNS